MLACLFIVIFVKAADQLFEHSAYAMVVQRRQLDAAVGILHRQRREIDLRVEEIFNQVAQNVGIHQLLDLVVETELGEDFLDVRRKSIQIRNKIITQPLACGTGLELGQSKFRYVVEGLACCHTQSAVLLDHFMGIKELLAL